MQGTQAVMFRNSKNNQLFDVAIVNHTELSQSEVVLISVSFDAACSYVEDYNSPVISND